MDDEIPEVFTIETIEQMRAIADELRLRIGMALAHQAMTVTQLGALLGEQPAKIHYHVRELERVGLVRLVETREKGGILEKYYRAAGKNINVPPTLLQSASPDSVVAAANEYLQVLTQGFLRTLSAGIALGLWEGPEAIPLSVGGAQVWMTPEELKRVKEQIDTLLEPYSVARGIAGEREITFGSVIYQVRVPDSGEHTAAPTARARDERWQPLPPTGSPSTKRPRTRFTVGGTSISRNELEEIVARGESLSITSFGYTSFASDVTPELVDRAIARFHHRGVLNASPEVREVLKRKEG